MFGASKERLPGHDRVRRLAARRCRPTSGFSPVFGDTLLIIPFLCFWILWPIWGATLYGEVRGASDFRRVMGGMMWGLWVTIAIAVVFLLLASKFFGWDFFNAGNLNFSLLVRLHGDIPGPPDLDVPAVARGDVLRQRADRRALVLLFGAWFLGWAGTLFLSSTRVIFAAAFDGSCRSGLPTSPSAGTCRCGRCC